MSKAETTSLSSEVFIIKSFRLSYKSQKYMSEANNGNTPPVTKEKTLEEVLEENKVLARERDEAVESALKANRAVEAGRKFEKFEDFQNSVLGEIDSLKKNQESKDKEIEDLKKIISNKSAITPNTSSAPASPEEVKKTTEEELRVKSMFGLPVTK